MKLADRINARIAALLAPRPFREARTEDLPDFYSETAAEYEIWFADPKHDDIPFYLNLAQRTGSPVLEAACGSGRIMIPLADAEHRVVGADRCGTMLKRADERIRNRNGAFRDRTSLCRADMTALPFRSAFGLVLIPYNSFNHLLTNEDQAACLNSVHTALRPGGLLAMELLPFHRVYHEGYRIRKIGYDPEKGRFGVLFSKVDHDTERSVHTVKWCAVEWKPGKRPETRMSMFRRSDLQPESIEELLADRGFSNISKQSAYGGRDRYANRVLIVAEKQDDGKPCRRSS